MFLPYLSGERTPHNNPNAQRVFLGLKHEHGKKEMTQAILEGVAYAFGDCQQVLLDAGTDLEARTEYGWTPLMAAAAWNANPEVVRALLDANPHQADTIFAAVFQDSLPSARVLTNAGFEYIGDAEAWSVARNAKVPTWTYLKKL